MNPLPSCLPCAVQVGFSGARNLFARDGLSTEEIAGIENEIVAKLARVLTGLREELGLAPHHFLAGLSQVATGGDTYFTRACAECAGMKPAPAVLLQRIFLPQPIDAFLDAVGSKGPDFSAAEKRIARDLLKSAHIAHVHCVSNADDRHERLQEASNAILAECDVAVCLVRPNPEIKPGGSGEFIFRAQERGKPLVLIEVTVAGKLPTFEVRWLAREKFAPPALPVALRTLPCPVGPVPDVAVCVAVLRKHFSPRAGQHRKVFESAARTVIGTHVGATFCAAVALAVPASIPYATPLLAALLTIELVLLLIGFFKHHHLRQENRGRDWAADRLAAESIRSLEKLAGIHLHLAHLFQLRLKDEPGWKSLLTTLNLLHLKSTRGTANRPVREQAESYVARRLDDGSSGQIPYYRRTADKAKDDLAKFNRTFYASVTLAIAATATKLATKSIPGLHGPEWLGLILGTMAVVFPVLAVGALSWANALDFQARATIHQEMARYLQSQRDALSRATTHRELRRLILETETGMLTEVAEWYSRRAILQP